MRTVEHTTHHNRIHQFTFLESSRAAIDEWIDFMELLLAKIPLSQSILIIIDMQQSGVLSLTTVHISLRKLFEAHKDRPPGKIALILSDEISPSLGISIENIFNSHNEAQLFTDYDKAWDWISRQNQ